jgi:6-phosphogluconolactonase
MDKFLEVAEQVEKTIKELDKTKETIIFGIVGGRSIGNVLNILKEKNLPWRKIHFFMLDERNVPIDDEESNYKIAKEELFDFLIEKNSINESNFHPFIKRENNEEAVNIYSRELAQLGNNFDIILLSSGEDGHIASLFPENKVLEVNELKYIFVDDSPKPPKERITVSKELIKNANNAILMFFVESKKEAYKKFLSEENPKKIPACFVKECENIFVFKDF